MSLANTSFQILYELDFENSCDIKVKLNTLRVILLNYGFIVYFLL